jgi:hypothetical protein
MYGLIVAGLVAYVILPKLLNHKRKKTKRELNDDDNILSHLVHKYEVNDTNGLMPSFRTITRIPDETLKNNPLTNPNRATTVTSIPSDTEDIEPTPYR